MIESTAELQSGVIEEALPRRLFRVRLDGGRLVTASIGTQAQRTHVSFLPGDTVLLTRSTYDPDRARIEKKA